MLGNGSTTASSVPVAVGAIPSGVAELGTISAGVVCARSNAGAAYCWGGNETGALGIGSHGAGQYSATPVAVLGLGSGVQQVSGGYAGACAVTVAGDAYCWGESALLPDDTFPDAPLLVHDP
jgi:hypothetical protein